MAMTLAGWCSRVFRPWASPAKIWIGAATATRPHGHVEHHPRAGLVLSFSRCRRPRPRPPGPWSVGAEHRVDQAVGEGRVEDDRQPARPARTGPPSLITKPCGVCIQLLAERIQKAEMKVPIATARVAAKCSLRPTSVHAEQHDPQEARLQEEALSSPRRPSAARRSARPSSENTDQLVPNW